LIIEPFSKWQPNKMELGNCIGILGHFWCCWKAFDESGLIEFISQI
jgi:hypothetical protein